MPRGPKGEKRAQTDHRLDNKSRCEGTSSLNPINHCLSQHATISAVHRFRRSSDSLLPLRPWGLRSGTAKELWWVVPSRR
jgi:hypothetical protein